jgi:hypothetical protein
MQDYLTRRSCCIYYTNAEESLEFGIERNLGKRINIHCHVTERISVGSFGGR